MRVKSGQITVLVLLLSMLTLVAGLSIASRSLSDLKQATYVDSGTRALAAAEAGLQYAFANACDATTCTVGSPRPINAFNLPGLRDVTYEVAAVTKNFYTVPNVPKDDVVQINFGHQPSNLKAVDVSWRGDASVEIEVIDQDNRNNYLLRRYAYNAATVTGRARANGLAAAMTADYCNSATVCDSSFGLADSCTGPSEILFKPDATKTAQAVRIRPLYQTTDISLCGRASGNSQWNLQSPSYQVTATATALDGSVKKVRADYYPAALPAIFDYVLYSGGNISK